MATSATNKPIRVLHVVDILGLAGMEYGVIKLVNRLAPKDFFPMICCLKFQGDITRSLLDPRIPVFELRERPGRDIRTLLKLASLLRRQRIDIVHSHNWATLFYAVSAATMSGVPITIHGEHGRETVASRRRQLLLSRWLSQRFDRLSVVSADLGRDLVEHWRVKPERVVTIPNGVDLNSFGVSYSLDALRNEFRLTAENRVVLNISHFRPIKDHLTLVRAFARVHARHPEARLVLVGKDLGTCGEVVKLAEELGILDALRFAGIRHDIAKLLALCDVYVNTSLFEGMSNTILEAMAARKPVVATDVGGNPELVRDNVTGFLVSPQDDQGLAARLERLLTVPGLSKNMGDAGRAVVERDHSMSRMIEAYSELYQETVWRRQLKMTVSGREKTKAWVARGLRWSGVNRLKEMAEPSQLSILTYHRLLPLHESFSYPFSAMVTPKDLFEAQMAYLAKSFTVLGLPDAVRRLQQGKLPRRSVVVTFDDGYRDNYEHAWPILKKYGIPATFFVVTGALDGTIRLWWDDVAEDILRLLRNSPLRNGAKSALPPWLAPILETVHEKSPHAIAQEVVHRLNGLGCAERMQTLERLRALARSISNEQSTSLMMSWEQARELHRSGMHIGAHTVTHAFLDELDDNRAAQEIEGSIQRIQECLGFRARLFSYPRGRFEERAQKLLRRAGIEAAVTTHPGRNRPGNNLLQLKRLDAGYYRFNGGFSPAVFSAELEGWFNPLHRW